MTRRPTTPERGGFLDEGDDRMEEFPTSELTMAELEELKAATSLEQFKIGKMFESGRQRQQDTAKLWNELQRIAKEGPAAAAERRRQIRFKEWMAEEAEAEEQRRMEEAKAEAAKQQRMEEAAEAAKQQRMEAAAKQQQQNNNGWKQQQNNNGWKKQQNNNGWKQQQNNNGWKQQQKQKQKNNDNDHIGQI
jgi:hypothetical protein